MDRFMEKVAFEQSMGKEFANLPYPYIPRIGSLPMPDFFFSSLVTFLC